MMMMMMMICIEMDLALNNPQMLICHKTQTTQPVIKYAIIVFYLFITKKKKNGIWGINFSLIIYVDSGG